MGIIASILCAAGCTHKQQTISAEPTYKITISPEQQETLSPQPNIIKTVPLETRPDCLIRQIDKLYVLPNDNLLIYDQNGSLALLFDPSGKFLQKVGQKGQGPEEYVEIGDLEYDVRTKQIYIYDRYTDRMFIYDAEGTLLQTLHSSLSFNSFTKTEAGYWLYFCYSPANTEHYQLVYADDSLTEIKSGYFATAAFTDASYTSRFAENMEDGSRYFYYNGSDVLWLLSDKITPFVQFDFQDLTLPYEAMSQAETPEAYREILSQLRGMGYIDHVRLSNGQIWFNCSESGSSHRSYTGWYERNQKQLHLYGGVSYSGEAIPIAFQDVLAICADDVMVYAANPQEMSPSNLLRVHQQFPDVTVDDNPILFFVQ
jgi:hypothetical protein